MSAPIYLDHNATTPVDPRVLEAMLPHFREAFGNAASPHAYGCAANSAVEKAREQAASLIHADPREIVWTSGATESDNLAIKGVAAFYKEKGRHIVSAIHEHHAVLDPCRRLESQGCQVTWLSPAAGTGGIITAAQVAAALRPDTILVSIMWANNEVGTINDIATIGALCHERGVLFHTDATQAVGKISIDVEAANVDLLSASAHKFYGPKGVGFLYVRRKGPRVRLESIMDGGGHERGMRSGTLNVPGIVGLGKASEICREELPHESQRMRALRDHLESSLLAAIPGAVVNGNVANRLPQTCNISLAGVESDQLIAAMPDVAVSAGAACSSASREISYVLRAIGVPEELARGAMRLSVGRFTTREECDCAARRIIETMAKMKDAGAACEVAPMDV